MSQLTNTSAPKVLFTASVVGHILAFHIPYLKWLKGHGYVVHVAAAPDKRQIPYCDYFIPIDLARSPFKFTNLYAYRKLRALISEQKYSLVHCHTPVASVITRLASRRTRRTTDLKVFYTAHGFHFFNGAPLKNWLIFLPIEKLLAHYTDYLFVMNSEDEANARKHLTQRVRLIRTNGVGVDINRFSTGSQPELERLRKTLGIRKDKVILFYPAEISHRKNQDFLLRVVTQLKECTNNFILLLAGRDATMQLPQKIMSAGLELYVKYLGFRRDIPLLYQLADIGVSSSRQEGLPVNLQEAMAAASAIVATDCRGNRDLIEEGHTGFLVPQGDEKTYIKRLTKLINNENLRNEMGLNALKHAQQFAVEKVVPQVIKYYQETLPT